MPRIHLTQKGFAAVEAILIVVILAIIGGTGYYVYHASNKSTDTLNTANLASQSTPIPKKKTAAKKPGDAQSYLAIKELGVKLPLSDADKDLSYAVSKNDQNTVYVSLKSLPSGCEATADGGGSIGAIFRFKANDINPDSTPPETYLAAYPTAPKVGDYYYSYQEANGGCLAVNQDAKTAEIVKAADKAIVTALPKITAN